MPEFKAEVFQNEYLPEGATDVHAVVSVTCTRGRHGRADRPRRGRRDASSSTRPARWTCRRRRSPPPAAPPRWRSRRSSTAPGSPCVSGHSVAQMVYPTHPGMAKMTATTRRDAIEAVGQLRSGGATAIGAWIAAATELFEQAPSTGSATPSC